MLTLFCSSKKANSLMLIILFPIILTATGDTVLKGSYDIATSDNQPDLPVNGGKINDRALDDVPAVIREKSSSIAAYSYTMDVITYSWYNASENGYDLGISGDDTYEIVDLPFSFYYYDTAFNTVYVSSNGYFSFVDTNDLTEYWNPPFPSSSFPYTVALFWIDLDFQSSGNVYVWSTTDFVVIEYNNAPFYNDGTAGTFEAIFFANGSICFQYHSVTSDPGATVGLNYGDMVHYTSYSGGLSGETDFSLLFSRPEHDLAVSLETPANLRKGETALINATVFNNGINDETSVTLKLLIDDAVVDTGVYPSLLTGSNQVLTYLWTPSTGGTFNITAYAVPVTGETLLLNNNATEFAFVLDQHDLYVSLEAPEYIR
ncbi:MAG: CARDB domain-containing protein, partial [Candidatus Odinarchaeota archaeon]